jgi:hypothetical protein
MQNEPTQNHIDLSMNDQQKKISEPFSSVDLVSAWLGIIPIIFVLYILLTFVAPHLASKPNVDQIQHLFTTHLAVLCSPHPLKQMRYLLAIVAIPLTFFGVPLWFERWKPHSNHKRLGRGFALGAIGIQILLTLLIFRLWMSQIGICVYFSTSQVAFSLAAATGLLGLLFFRTLSPEARWNFYVPNWSQKIVWTLAVALTGIALMPSVYTDGNLLKAHGIVVSHFYTTYGEFSAILNGKTSLVDYYPQYQNLLSYLTLPIFKLFGLSTLSYTLTMAFLSFVGMLAIFKVFRKLTQSSWKAFALYISFLSISFYPSSYPQLLNSFNYYAMWPLRYFLPSVCAYFLVRTLASPTRMKIVLFSFFCSLTALNNLDFGIPTWVGCLAALLATTEVPFFKNLRPHLRILTYFLVGTLGALLSFYLGTWLRSGQVPDFLGLIQFQSIFALHGFNMMDTPRYGLHGVIFLTYIAALLMGISSWFTSPPRSSQDRQSIGLLFFCAIFGCGTFMYYLGRSHPLVLITLFPGWAFAGMIVLWNFIRPFFEKPQMARRRIAFSVLPAALLFFHYALFLSVLPWVESPIIESKRFFIHSDDLKATQQKFVNYVKQKTHQNEEVTLLFPDGEGIAREAGVKNQFLYNSHYSLILKKQVQKVILELDAHQIKKVVGAFPPHYIIFKELKDGLKEIGFRLIESQPVGDEVLEYWAR